MPRVYPSLIVAAVLALAAPALAGPPAPYPKPPNPQEQAVIDLDQLKKERDRRLSAAQDSFQSEVTEATQARDAAIAEARQAHDAMVEATRAWYEDRRRALEAAKSGRQPVAD